MASSLSLRKTETAGRSPILSRTDYSKWERKPLKSSAIKPRDPHLAKAVYSSHNGGDGSLVSTQSFSCSSLCHHGGSSGKTMVKKPLAVAKKKTDNVSILKMQISSVMGSINECKQHYVYLVRENIRLKEEITSKEKNTNTAVSELLEKYHKFRGTMALMKRKHAENITEAQKDLDQMEASMTAELEGLTLDCEQIVKEVNDKRSEIKKLCTYKEKEYPEMVLKIGKLKRDITLFDEACEAELKELGAVMETEEGKYRDEVREVGTEVHKTTAKRAVDKHSSVDMEIALQNSLMKKELAIHQSEIDLLEYEIEELNSKIRKLRNSRRTRTRMRLSPWPTEVCHPETELTLDIPREDYLPI